jgi:protein-S-isoprenylcysteine O-methyltransferase Ste14
MTTVSVAAGLVLDVLFHTRAFPLMIRLFGLLGIVVAHFPLKRTGRLLKDRGGVEEQWGCTTRLVTNDIYQCVRHPHHLGVGIFMTSVGLLIGHLWSFLLITIVQWTWIIIFLYMVEEKELEAKFGDAYLRYKADVPMLLTKPRCLLQFLSTSIQGAAIKKKRQKV